MRYLPTLFMFFFAYNVSAEKIADEVYGYTYDEQTSTEQTSTEQTSTEQTSTEQTSTEQTSTDQTSTDQTSTDQTSTDQTSTDQTSTDQTSTDQTSTDQTSTDQTSTEQTSTEQKDASNPYSTISFGYSGSHYSRSLSLDTSIALNESDRLLAGHSISQDWDSEPDDGLDSKTNGFFVGLSRDFNENTRGSFYYDRWGQSSSLINHGFASRLVYLPGDDWSVSAKGGYHIIRYRTANSFEKSPSTHLGVGTGFFGWEPLGFFLNYTKYFYEKEISSLVNDYISSRIPLSVLILSSTFVSESSFAGISFFSDKFTVDLEAFRSVSAIDGVSSKGLTLRLNLDFLKRWSLSLEAGRSVNEYEEPEKNSYRGATVNYFW